MYYFVELKSIFRPRPGDKWISDEGVVIHVSIWIVNLFWKISKLLSAFLKNHDFFLEKKLEYFQSLFVLEQSLTHILIIQQTHVVDEDKCIRAEEGDTLHQQYTLHLQDGTFLDSSWSRNKPFIFVVGKRQVGKLKALICSWSFNWWFHSVFDVFLRVATEDVVLVRVQKFCSS